MSAETAAYREVIERLPTDSTLILRGISWDDYEELLAAVGEAPGLRISYDQGTMQIMTPSSEHESYVRLIERLVAVFGSSQLIRARFHREGAKGAKVLLDATGLSYLGQVFLEEVHRPLPREFGGGLVVPRRRVVVEPVLRAGVLVHLVLHVVRLQRRFVGRPPGVDTIVILRVMNEQRRFDIGDVRGSGLPAVEGYCRREIRQPRREHIDDAAAVAEPDRADLSGAVRSILQKARRGHEILPYPGLTELREDLPRFVLVARVAAERRQRVGRERHEVVERETPGNVLDVRIQPTVLVHDENARQLAFRGDRTHQVSTRLFRSLRRWILEVFALQTPVVLGYLLGLRELGIQRVQQRRRGQSADGKPCGAIEEAATVDRAMNVLIEEVQEFLVEITRLLAVHICDLQSF